MLNDCEKCPYYSSYIPYWSDDGCPVEDCGAGLNPEDSCRHNRLVRWILFNIQQRKERKQDAYMMSFLEQEEKASKI
jgi:hypothetical protein